MGQQVQVLGIKEVQRALDGVGQDIALSGKAGKDAATLVAHGAAGIGADRSGKLSGSWRGLGSKKRGRVVSRLIYAPVIEFGFPRRGIVAQARVQRSIQANSHAIQAIYERYCRDVLAKRQAGGR